MKNKLILGLILLILLGSGVVYLIHPSIFHSITWHTKKAVQSIYQHEVKLMNVPLVSQTRNLNCEAATIKMILKYYNKDTDIDVIQNSYPKDLNPHKGFRGNVDGDVWGFDDYGVYAEPVATALNKFGVPAKAYSGITAEFLKEQVLKGKPAIIWVNISNPDPQIKTEEINGEKVKLVSGQHVAVVTGYNNGTWVLNDPWRTTSEDGERLGKELFVDDLDEIMWNEFDHMAVIVDRPLN